MLGGVSTSSSARYPSSVGLFYLTPTILEEIRKDNSCTITENSLLEKSETMAFAKSVGGTILRWLTFPALIYWRCKWNEERAKCDGNTYLSECVKVVLNSTSEKTSPRPLGGRPNLTPAIRIEGSNLRPVECGGEGDCYFFTVANQVLPDGDATSNMKECRTQHFLCAIGQLETHLERVGQSYPEDLPIRKRIERLQTILNVPDGADLHTWAETMSSEVRDLAAEIRYYELARRHVNDGDQAVRLAAEALENAIAERGTEGSISTAQMADLSRLRNMLVLQYNRARVAAWQPPLDNEILASQKIVLLEKIDRAIADPANNNLFQEVAEFGIELNKNVLTVLSVSSDKSARDNLRTLNNNIRERNYSPQDIQASLAHYAANNQNLLAWKEIDGRFCTSRFEDNLFDPKIREGSPLLKVNQGSDTRLATWTDGNPSALARYVNYATNVIFKEGEYGGIHELELSCLTYKKPVLHVDRNAPDAWSLVFLDGNGRCRVLTGQIASEPVVRPPASTSNNGNTMPIFNIGAIQDLRAAWDALNPQNEGEHPIAFPDLSPLVDTERGRAMTYGELETLRTTGGITDTTQAIRDVQNKLQDAYRQLFHQCIRPGNGILCYNISQAHWQKLVPVPVH
ncbi:MAG: hypothetical protein LBB14_01770 [Puniceicoccales bacterium]|jgi:hypothetical protein|nr:hypothetical protein [Puniceicoccales bacterium]